MVHIFGQQKERQFQLAMPEVVAQFPDVELALTQEAARRQGTVVLVMRILGIPLPPRPPPTHGLPLFPNHPRKMVADRIAEDHNRDAKTKAQRVTGEEVLTRLRRALFDIGARDALNQYWLRLYGKFRRVSMPVEVLKQLRPAWEEELSWIANGVRVTVEDHSWWIAETLNGEPLQSEPSLQDVTVPPEGNDNGVPESQSQSVEVVL